MFFAETWILSRDNDILCFLGGYQNTDWEASVLQVHMPLGLFAVLIGLRASRGAPCSPLTPYRVSASYGPKAVGLLFTPR